MLSTAGATILALGYLLPMVSEICHRCVRPHPLASELNTVVATDVLSEGLNLQDCDKIINYDLHWNPVRLIQRFGRIDRIGSDFDRVYGYNFLPETGIERNLGLRQRLHNRIQEIHDTIGEDAAILDRTDSTREPERLDHSYGKVESADVGALTSGHNALKFKYFPLPKSRCSMSDEAEPVRSWQEIAEKASHEQDSEKLKKLSEELERALDERAKRLHPTASQTNQEKIA